ALWYKNVIWWEFKVRNVGKSVKIDGDKQLNRKNLRFTPLLFCFMCCKLIATNLTASPVCLVVITSIGLDTRRSR
ncbi:MAG TPA: hypothetical protein PLA25_08315, partial [Anaerolineaceae bacterium]|nr:hypothetical protein [Anaerolineaceae bacterium]HQN44123.1 hypothetical protein [Anaerolineaceae bacterium]